MSECVWYYWLFFFPPLKTFRGCFCRHKQRSWCTIFVLMHSHQAFLHSGPLTMPIIGLTSHSFQLQLPEKMWRSKHGKCKVKLILSHCCYLQLPIDGLVQTESPVFGEYIVCACTYCFALWCLCVSVCVEDKTKQEKRWINKKKIKGVAVLVCTHTPVYTYIQTVRLLLFCFPLVAIKGL